MQNRANVAKQIVTVTFGAILIIELSIYFCIRLMSDLEIITYYLLHKYCALEQLIKQLYYPVQL